MTREQKIALLKAKGVQVADSITDAELDTLLSQNGENPTPAPEIPNNPVPPGNQPPPAAHLVNNGVVKSEREIQLENEREELLRQKKLLETTVSERERDIQELKKIPLDTPAPTPKPKRKIITTFFD